MIPIYALVLWLVVPINWCTTQQVDLGMVQAGQRVVQLFIYKNTGTQPEWIDNVRTTCGCTASSWDQAPLPPGATDTLQVIFQSWSKGPFHKKIKVYFHHQKRPHILEIRGAVEKKD